MPKETNFHDEDQLEKTYDARLMRRLVGYLRPYKLRAFVAVLLIVVSSLLQLAGPFLTAIAIDLFIRPMETGELEASTPLVAAIERQLEGAGVELTAAEGIQWVAVLFLASTVLSFFVLYLQGYLMQVMGQLIMYDLRRDLFGHLQKLSIGYFDRRPIGRLVTRVTNDVGALNELFTAGLVSVFGDVMLLSGIVAMLFLLNWRLALVTFSIVPVLLAVTLWFRVRARQSYRAVRVKLAKINSFLQEHISGMSVVQLFGVESRAYDDFEAINDEHRVANVRAIFYYAVYYPSVELVTAVGAALVLWYGGARVLEGALSLGALVAFLQYSARFYQPLADLSEKYNILQSAMASSERIFELLDRQPEIAAPVEAFRPQDIEGLVEFDQVSFAYNPDEPVLRDINFTIRPGETLAVVGHTGAGKSTLVNLLMRFYDVDAGVVRIDGRDVRQWDLQALRSATGMVLQDVFLFSGSVASNIRLGNEAIDAERLRWAAEEVQASEFIDRLPEGYEAEVRERGAGLSAGQRQLISFARALAFDPQILILDEATSSIDSETEMLIQKALERLLVGRTSLVIAHRLSTIQRADRILVMHKGEIRESGTHKELLEAGGIYSRLVQLQYRSREAGERMEEEPQVVGVRGEIAEASGSRNEIA